MELHLRATGGSPAIWNHTYMSLDIREHTMP